MLVVQRKIGEAILMTGGIRVVIVDVRSGDRVRVGIIDPDEIEVVREELAATWHGRPGFGPGEGK